jgi:hypothetical protein
VLAKCLSVLQTVFVTWFPLLEMWAMPASLRVSFRVTSGHGLALERVCPAGIEGDSVFVFASSWRHCV